MILLTALMTACFAAKSQEPVAVTGYFTKETVGEQISTQAASELFIQGQACVAFTSRSLASIKLIEESAQRIGRDTIRVAFVNNAGSILPSLYGKKPLMLDIFPFKDDIYYCKNYICQSAEEQYSIKLYDNIENEITKFFEYAVQGDSLKQSLALIDSRYTPLLIKKLSDNTEVYVQQILHGDGIKYIKFLGIVIKKKNFGFSEIYYQKYPISSIARAKLYEIFRSRFWNFSTPESNASSEEWQAWLDELLKDSYKLASENI